jgi:hypothetical protein
MIRCPKCDREFRGNPQVIKPGVFECICRACCTSWTLGKEKDKGKKGRK